MTFGKASALALGFVGALLIGVWVSPHVREYASTMNAPDATTAAPTSVVKGGGLPKDSQPAASTTARATKPAAKPVAVVAASEEKVQAHVKPLLNRGADMEKASDGFRDAEQFVTIAHAARNTEIPFILLKHRVLTEGKSLSAAIRASKPQLDASVEANRARAEAKSDIAKLRAS